MSGDLVFEFTPDEEGMRVRRFRERRYLKAGIGEHVAYRLAWLDDLDWHRVVGLKERGASDDDLVRIYLD